MKSSHSFFSTRNAVGGVLGLLLALAGVSVEAARTQQDSSEGSVRLKIPRLPSAPAIDDFADMRPTGAAVVMSQASGFINRVPRDGVAMSEKTEVYFGYDEQNLYAVFVCFDSDPGGIRSHMNGRDHVPESDDSIALQIDTFRDRKHAYGFQANAEGVQQDGLWTEGKGWDLSFDTVWRTDSRRTDRGYIVSLSIPFRSLRFPRDAVQNWGFLVYRGIARNNEEGFWPRYSTRTAGRMNQAAIMEGLENVSPGRNVQVVPYVSGRSFRTLEIDPRQGGRFVTDPAQGEMGADAKLVIKDSFSVDLTANPDFSQVESDEPQVTVNKRFETFFPEKRPFFLENSSYFDTPIQLLFSRRIADPDVGVRITGRQGRYAVGALAVRDKPGSDAADVFVLRVNRDIGTESSIGFFGSSRDVLSRVNRVGGFDARFKIGTNWFATGQAVATSRGPSRGPGASGSAYRAGLLRSGRSFTYNGDFNDRAREFETELGFVERTDIRSLDQTFAYRRMPVGSRLLSYGPELVVSEVRDHENEPLDRTITPKVSFEWPGQTRLSLFHQEGHVRLRPQEVTSLDRRARFDQDRHGIEASTSFTRSLTLSVKASTGDGINLVPVRGAKPGAALARDLSVVAEIRPTPRLNLALSYLRTHLRDPKDVSIFTDHILRARMNYQFTRSLSFRAIVLSDRLSASEALTSLESRRSVNVDLLLTYLRTPGTALYIGYNNNLQNLDPELRMGSNGLLRSPGGLLSDGRQFFVKASYLFRR